MLDAEQGSAVLPGEGEHPLHVLLPSPLGQMGVEIAGGAVTRLVIEPSREQRKGYIPFSDLVGESEFLDELFGRMSEYFAGARRNLDIRFDLGPSGVVGFTRRVLRETAKIPYGRTRTYGRVAEAAGRPDAYRQVLSILLENPIPILIPCHRVVTHKSGVGSFVAGQERKRWLLAMEREGLEMERDQAARSSTNGC